MAKDKKTIFLTLSTRAVFRNLFFFPGGVFSKLRERAENKDDLKVVLLVPKREANKYDNVLGEGRDEWYFVEPVKTVSSRGVLEKFFYFFYSYLIYTGTTKVLATMSMRPDEPPAGGRRYLASIKWLIANTFGRIKFVKTKVVPRLFLKIFRERPFKDVFEKYNPSMVFISHLYGWTDQHLLAEAKRQKVKTVGMAAGWDHLDKYFLPFHVDTLLAQSHEIKASAIKYQSYPTESIEIVGYPHFDFITDLKNILPKEEIMTALGFPADSRYFVYVSGSAYCPDEPDIVEKIISWIDEGKFGENAHLIVRPYAGGRSNDREFDYEKFNRFAKHPRVYFFDHDLWGDVEKSRLFVNILRYSSVVIAVYTTIALEAVALDRPILAPAFDGYKKRSAHRSISRFEKFEHFQGVLKTGAMKTARNFDDLFIFLNNYLQDSSIDDEERELMRQKLCYKLDCLASKRVADFILKNND